MFFSYLIDFEFTTTKIKSNRLKTNDKFTKNHQSGTSSLLQWGWF